VITIFAPMRPFRGETAQLQLNTVRSWLATTPACEVILAEDEEGTTRQAVSGLGVRVVDGVRRAASGVPLFDSFVEQGIAHARGDIVVCSTADVLVPPDFTAVIEAAAGAFDGGDYFLAAGRHDLRRPLQVDFDAPDWFARVHRAVRAEGQRAGHQYVDLWAHPRRLPFRPPPLPMGRYGTDGWAVYEMKRRGIPVVDISDSVCLVHQPHPRAASDDPGFLRECREVVRLFDGMAEHAMSLLDADWLWRDDRLVRPTGLRRLHAAMSLFPPYRSMVGLRRRLRLPHLYGAEAAG